MLQGEPWFLGHLLSKPGRGHTKTGMAFTARVREEHPTITVVCDDCGTPTTTHSDNLGKVRSVIDQVARQEELWGQHCCAVCARKRASERTAGTKSSPEWRSSFAESVTLGMAKMTDKEAWKDSVRRGTVKTYATMTPEQRSRGVISQWQTMSETVKSQRATRVGAGTKRIWDAYTPEERSARVSKMIRGLPRSKLSDEFRQSLIEEGLYEGFASEQAISGFTVDECHEASKTIIEFFGDYYHCNPSNPKFADPAFYNTTTKKTSAEKWEYDRRRLAGLRKAGYTTLVIWESEWRADEGEVLDRIRLFLTQRGLLTPPTA